MGRKVLPYWRTELGKFWGDRVTRVEDETRPLMIKNGYRYQYFGICDGCQTEICLDRHRRVVGHFFCNICAKCIGMHMGEPIFNQLLWDMRDEIVRVVPNMVTKADGSVYTKRVWRMKCRTPLCGGDYLFTNIKCATLKGKTPLYACKPCGYLPRTKRPHEAAYNALVTSCSRRRDAVTVELTYEEYFDLCQIGQCTYCNEPLNRALRNEDYTLSPSQLDRIDPCKGYSVENVVPCCAFCNYTKNAYVTAPEMIIIGLLRQGKKEKAGKLLAEFAVQDNLQTLSRIKTEVFDRRIQAMQKTAS